MRIINFKYRTSKLAVAMLVFCAGEMMYFSKLIIALTIDQEGRVADIFEKRVL